MRIPARFSLALLLAAFPLHAQETPDPIEFSQEEYNQKVAREMEEMNQALQAMSRPISKKLTLRCLPEDTMHTISALVFSK